MNRAEKYILRILRLTHFMKTMNLRTQKRPFLLRNYTDVLLTRQTTCRRNFGRLKTCFRMNRRLVPNRKPKDAVICGTSCIFWTAYRICVLRQIALVVDFCKYRRFEKFFISKIHQQSAYGGGKYDCYHCGGKHYFAARQSFGESDSAYRCLYGGFGKI